MPTMTFDEQIASHIAFLQANGVAVTELVFSNKFTRCHSSSGEESKRGGCAYKSFKNPMRDKGKVGIVTTCRIPGGAWVKHETYGLDGDAKSSPFFRPILDSSDALHEKAARNTCGFWHYSKTQGTSDYLDAKGVGYYGIRFRSTEKHGNAAVVPMFDENGRLWNRQLLNRNGSKLMATGGRTEGLFHVLRKSNGDELIGIAESYVTAATCMELVGTPTVCAFSSENLKSVAQTIRRMYPRNPIVILADNDQHLEKEGKPNKGILKAQEAQDTVGHHVVIAAPDFGDLKPSKEATDWNDLARLKGDDVARAQLMRFTSSKYDHEGQSFSLSAAVKGSAAGYALGLSLL
ncbi:MAG: toprim domain-containing protein [Verrucomicrobia bacterium]|nr:toprim domain-containing protein [Verrucomicrobiota bacterium]